MYDKKLCQKKKFTHKLQNEISLLIGYDTHTLVLKKRMSVSADVHSQNYLRHRQQSC